MKHYNFLWENYLDNGLVPLEIYDFFLINDIILKIHRLCGWCPISSDILFKKKRTDTWQKSVLSLQIRKYSGKIQIIEKNSIDFANHFFHSIAHIRHISEIICASQALCTRNSHEIPNIILVQDEHSFKMSIIFCCRGWWKLSNILWFFCSFLS